MFLKKMKNKTLSFHISRLFFTRVIIYYLVFTHSYKLGSLFSAVYSVDFFCFIFLKAIKTQSFYKIMTQDITAF